MLDLIKSIELLKPNNAGIKNQINELEQQHESLYNKTYASAINSIVIKIKEKEMDATSSMIHCESELDSYRKQRDEISETENNESYTKLLAYIDANNDVKNICYEYSLKNEKK